MATTTQVAVSDARQAARAALGTTDLNRRSRKASQGAREARENPRMAQQRAKTDRRKDPQLGTHVRVQE